MSIKQFSCQRHEKPQQLVKKGLPWWDLDLFFSASPRKEVANKSFSKLHSNWWCTEAVRKPRPMNTLTMNRTSYLNWKIEVLAMGVGEVFIYFLLFLKQYSTYFSTQVMVCTAKINLPHVVCIPRIQPPLWTEERSELIRKILAASILLFLAVPVR